MSCAPVTRSLCVCAYPGAELLLRLLARSLAFQLGLCYWTISRRERRNLEKGNHDGSSLVKYKKVVHGDLQGSLYSTEIIGTLHMSL